MRNVLNASQRRINKNSLTWWYVLKTSWRYLCKTSWTRLQNVLKTSWRCLEDIFQDVLTTFSRHVGKTSWRRLEDVWPRRIYWSWTRRLEDVFWRRKARASIFVSIKTSWRRILKTKMEDVLKTSSSKQMFAAYLY